MRHSPRIFRPGINTALRPEAQDVDPLLFSGFLGSGKTTFIISLAKTAADAGRRVAVVVNEIGEIGIDNQLMRALDLNVWELTAGCICCTLSGDLVAVLEKLDGEYSPDLIVVEASGTANPGAILSSLKYYHGLPFLRVRTVTLVDPLRASMLMQVMSPLITAQIEHADTVIISKTDVAGPEETQSAAGIARAINGRAQILKLSGKGQIEPGLFERLLWRPI